MSQQIIEKTYTIGEIMRLFNLETPGDAWALVIESDWDCSRTKDDAKWQVAIPTNQLPAR